MQHKNKHHKQLYHSLSAILMALILCLYSPLSVLCYAAEDPAITEEADSEEGTATTVETTEDPTSEEASGAAGSEGAAEDADSAATTEENDSEEEAEEAGAEEVSTESGSEAADEEADPEEADEESEDTEEESDPEEDSELLGGTALAEEDAELLTATGKGTVTFTTEGSTTTAKLSESATGIAAETDDGVTTVTISAAGSYTLTGSAVNTCVVIDKKLTGIELTLDDLTIDDTGLCAATEADSPVITVGKSSSVTWVLTGTNTLTGSSTFAEEPAPVIKGASAELTFTGTGSLTVTDGMKKNASFATDNNVDPADGISAKAGTITFTSGTVNVTKVNGSAIKAKEGKINIAGGTVNTSYTYDSALKAKDGNINITNGTLTVSYAYDTALHAKMESVSTAGISISGGTVNITDEIYGDGIKGENVDISGGTVNVTTVYDTAATGYYTNGSSSTAYNTLTENESSGLKTERINVNTGDHAAIKGGTKESTRIFSDLLSDDPNNAAVTYAASGGITISGGEINLNTTGAGLKANSVSGYTKCATGVYIIGCPDDALHSNNDLTITGGSITIHSSDDGITAAGDLTITGSETSIDIEQSFEGMESPNIVIGTQNSSDGPTVSISADDDGINAAQKLNTTYTYDSSDDEDCNYTKTTVKGTGNSCTIYSGTVTVKIDSANSKSRTLRNGSASSIKTVSYTSDGDGIDCNGSLDLEGGTIYVFGAYNTSNSPLDSDDGFTLGADATLLATGSDSMGESTPGYGDATYITYGGNSGHSGGPSARPGGGSSSTSISAGSVFKVVGDSAILIEHALPYAATFLIYASPELADAGSYTATIDDTTISASKSTVDDSGSSSVTVKTVSVSPTSSTLKMGKSTTLEAKLTPSGSGHSSTPSVNWTSSDPTIASVAGYGTSATVYALKAGTATITATAGSVSGSATITVSKQLVTAITLSGDSFSIEKGASETVSATVTPSYATDSTINWTSSDESIATVSPASSASCEEITITGVAMGDATITATAADGSGIYATCDVNVYNNTTVTLDQSTMSLYMDGTTGTLTATITTSDGSTPDVVWTSSNESKATVTALDPANDKYPATITPIANGKTTITVTANGERASCVVTVRTDYTDTASGQDSDVSDSEDTAPEESIAGDASATYYKGEMVKGQKSAFGAGAWSSSNTKVLTVGKKNGQVVAKAAGTATLCNTTDSGKIYYMITVLSPELSVNKVTMLVDDSVNISITGTGSLPVSWISANASVASATGEKYAFVHDGETESSAIGNITGIGKGTVKINVYVGSKAFPVTVSVKNLTSSVKLSDTATVTLNANQTYTPKFTNGFKVSGATWTEGDSQTALTALNTKNTLWTDANGYITITKTGRITAVSCGSVTLNGTDTKGNTVSLTITVKSVPIRTKLYLNVGQKTTLAHTYVKNTNAKTGISTQWTTDQDGIVTLTGDTKAKVTIQGVSTGSTVLTCVSNGLVYETTVYVEDPSIDETDPIVRPSTLNYNYTLSLETGDIYQVFQPDVEQDLVWKSSKTGVAFINEYGVIYARAAGKSTITTKVNNKTVRITVTVIDP